MTTHHVFAVFKTFFKLGLTSFGGPIAHIGYFRKELVEKQNWLNEQQFSQILAICQFLPGPASSQLGFALGLLRAGWLGAIAAFVAFTLPSAFLLVCFASALPSLSSAVGLAVIHGLKLVAVVVVADAVIGMAKRLCPDNTRRLIATTASIILLLYSIAWIQILVILLGGVAGFLFCNNATLATNSATQIQYSKSLAMRLLLLFFLLLFLAFFIPNTAGLYAIWQSFFQAGALVFGGGHVVLPLLQDAVVDTGWVSKESFIAGYGASQAIPGPMFAFAAYLGAIIPAAGQVSWLGATVALLAIFLPGFLLISAVLPVWQSITNNPNAANAIAGINAVVVGVLAATLYDPIFTTSVINHYDLFISIIGLAILMIGKRSPIVVVAWCVTACMVPAILSSQ